MRRMIAPVLVTAMLAGPALAQEAPKPGPQHARIGFFAGTWDFTAEAQANPMGPGGTIKGTDTCEWFAGGFQLVCRGDVSTSPRGPGKNTSIWTYDPMQQAYTYYAYNSLGEAFYISGNVTGNVWTWNADYPMEGMTMKLRVTLTEEGRAAYTYKVESSMDGATWAVMEQGRSTKRGQ